MMLSMARLLTRTAERGWCGATWAKSVPRREGLVAHHRNMSSGYVSSGYVSSECVSSECVSSECVSSEYVSPAKPRPRPTLTFKRQS